MRLLVLGGTRFVGRHLVAGALERGHSVSLFHRGKRNPGLFPEAEHLIGNRAGEVAALRGRRWDAVVDTSGYSARDLRASAEVLAGSVGHYTFVSTISVYADTAFRPLDEDAPLHAADAEGTEVTGATYGPMKAACEAVAAEAFAGRLLVVRPGLIAGPHDHTGRFPYWVHRVAAGGRVLAPGRPERPVQLVDARDLAAWTLRMAETGGTGTFNAAGPAETLTMEGMLHGVRDGVGGDARFTWVDDDFLQVREVAPWSEMPLWLTGGDVGLLQVDNRRAVAAGLAFRPVAETARDTWVTDRAEPPAEERKGGISRAREAELLAAWDAETAT